ncbi:MAG: mannose-1-phosphate guanylyltransferase [Clostridia bacterium]|nr:mannose-1-phosphate guanylyltransferase [Clostridia bacterium]
MLVALIMAGGRGERFWPKSREKLPKQFLDLTGQGTLLQLTARRINRIVDWAKVYVIAGRDYVELIKEQLPEMPVENIIVEPEGRNTAPCIGLASLHIQQDHPDAVMAVLPADHYIEDEEQYCDMVVAASRLAGQGDNLVTLGIRPDRPETGYGYIHLGEKYDDFHGHPGYKVARFVEKPDKETAEKYLVSGDYFWNSGMFLWKVSTIMEMYARFMPGLYQGLEKISRAWGIPEVLVEEFCKMDKTSIDYGIMEKAESIFVFPCDFGWDDVGSWTALERVNPLDNNGNVFKGQVIAVNTKGCIIEGSDKVIATLGIENLIVVDTGDVLLICPKEEAQNVRQVIQRIREEGLEKYL